jgi:hypothetical protein
LPPEELDFDAGILESWSWNAPPRSADELKLMLDILTSDYKVRSQAFSDDVLKMLDALGAMILVPLFTLLIGYLFGSRRGNG